MTWIGRIGIAVSAAAAVALASTYWLVEGEAATHAREHVAGAVVGGLVVAFVAFYEHTLGHARVVVRAAIALAVLYAAGVQLGEGIAAFGYDRLDAGERADLLVDAHGLFDSLATTSALAVGAAAVAWALVVLWQRGTRPPGAMLME